MAPDIAIRIDLGGVTSGEPVLRHRLLAPVAQHQAGIGPVHGDLAISEDRIERPACGLPGDPRLTGTEGEDEM